MTGHRARQTVPGTGIVAAAGAELVVAWPTGEDDEVKMQRKHAVLLLAVAAWNVVTYATFTRNLLAAHGSGEDRPTGYWVAHTVLIVVNLAIAGVLGSLGWQAWIRSRPSTRARIDA